MLDYHCAVLELGLYAIYAHIVLVLEVEVEASIVLVVYIVCAFGNYAVYGIYATIEVKQ